MNLAGQQQALLDALFGRWDEAALRGMATQNDAMRVRGLQAYRSNGHALARRALAGAFPVTAQMLEEENFDALARTFWHACPPEKGDIAHWGAGLADFIAQTPQLSEEKHLPDLASVEWALHEAATAADVQQDLASFALLLEHDPSSLALLPSAGLWVVKSPWPVVSMVDAHLTAEPQMAYAEQRLRDGIGEAAVIWRQGFKPMVRVAMPAEAALLSAVVAGQSLAAALDAALESNIEFEFNRWLVHAFQSCVIAGASLFQPEEKHE